jgi:hypothetical protein
MIDGTQVLLEMIEGIDRKIGGNNRQMRIREDMSLQKVTHIASFLIISYGRSGYQKGISHKL